MTDRFLVTGAHGCIGAWTVAELVREETEVVAFDVAPGYGRAGLLLDQGLLDEPCAPLLLVNGRDDVQNSIDDIYLSLDHGDPKAARVFDGGHMGEGPVVPTIVGWVTRNLR